MCLVCAICGPKVKVMHGCVNNYMHGAFFSLHSRGIICLMHLRVYRNSIVVFFSIIKSLFWGVGYFSILLQTGVFFPPNSSSTSNRKYP
jgi:hypothetical protein